MFLAQRRAIVTGVAWFLGCGGEPRDAIPPPGATYPEIAHIVIDASDQGRFVCSGVLLAPQVILTAGHCVDNHQRWEVQVAGSSQLSLRAEALDWNEGGSELVNPKRHDVGLVYLDHPVTLAAYPALSKVRLDRPTPATRLARRASSQPYQANIWLTAADSIGYPHHYMSTTTLSRGDSGGPVFLRGTHEILAVSSGVGSGIQVSARIDLVSQWISERLTGPYAATAQSP